MGANFLGIPNGGVTLHATERLQLLDSNLSEDVVRMQQGKVAFPLWTEDSYKMKWDCKRCEKQMDIVRLGCSSALGKMQF